MAVLDANVLVRYLTDDHLEHSARALAFMQDVESGSRAVMLPEVVLAEMVYVLSSKALYNVDRETIRTRLSTIVRLSGVLLANKSVCLNAFDVYVEHPRLSFVDALCVAHAQRTDGAVISFDRDFRRIDGVDWIEP